ncbi:Rpp14/Pop5 family protein [Candidatus Halobonum tyrrellensis]|uniref:Ribonuclease P protein component 2 n=1 Tax=Candidatus Halobonum tyrrellensis G22 TaxID=1324957 RepID=V4GW59_9EURY|nr:Rpp14/Pop5 family protein [Candidatus Halobonum tyrrellensis]ESP89381.1 RNaseP subunit 14 [Candidatus Halobonum tyrrellensis G22]
MKHLPKHVRPRWRYLAVGIETWPGASLSRGAFQREAWYAAQNLLGDAGSADADVTVVRFSHAAGAGEAAVRARRDEVDATRAALACLDAVDGTPVGLRVRGVSGTIRACEERYLGRAGGIRDERDVVFGTDRRRGHARDGAVDIETPSGFVGATDADISDT